MNNTKEQEKYNKRPTDANRWNAAWNYTSEGKRKTKRQKIWGPS